MLDNKLLQQEADLVKKKLSLKGYCLDLDNLGKLEQAKQSSQAVVEDLRARRNKGAKTIGQAKAKGDDVSELLAEMTNVAKELAEKQAEYEKSLHEWQKFVATIPNLPQDDVPPGRDEQDNIELHVWGDVPKFPFKPLDHVSLGQNLFMMDFNASAQLSGARFVVLRDGLAQLQRALSTFMLNKHTVQHGYQENYVPFLVQRAAMLGSGQLPKMEEDIFFIKDSDLALIPTAEVSLVNLYATKIVAAEDLPLKLCAHTPCFRAEAGSYGKDTRGMIRQHQFEKVELVQLVKPQDSIAAHEELLGHAEAILQDLGLPYRVVNLCGGDLGFGSAKTYDIEVWLPSQNTYREISSCSNCMDFQARRMQARYRCPETKKTKYLHTLNGSGVAVGRALVAIMENYQQEDGSIAVPKVLQSYMGGLQKISGKNEL